jgi:hypothetical protein
MMAHSQQRAFCESVKTKFSGAFTGKRVLEVGSLNINGTCRELFTDCDYLGIDVVAGKDVDLVVPAHLHKAADGGYDTIISTEALEHDLYWMATLGAIKRMLRAGGLFVLTCATTGRGEHGTARSKPQDAPGLPWPDHYRNITEDDVRWVYAPDMSGWKDYEFSIGHETSDLYFYGIKA